MQTMLTSYPFQPLDQNKELNRSASQTLLNQGSAMKTSTTMAEESEIRRQHYQGITAPEPTT